jgi:hypothetical protein
MYDADRYATYACFDLDVGSACGLTLVALGTVEELFLQCSSAEYDMCSIFGHLPQKRRDWMYFSRANGLLLLVLMNRSIS